MTLYSLRASGLVRHDHLNHYGSLITPSSKSKEEEEKVFLFSFRVLFWIFKGARQKITGLTPYETVLHWLKKPKS